MQVISDMHLLNWSASPNFGAGKLETIELMVYIDHMLPVQLIFCMSVLDAVSSVESVIRTVQINPTK